MYLYTEGHSRVCGTGVYLPEQRVKSEDLMQEFNATDRFGVQCEWLERVTGIKEKRVAPSGFSPSDMAVAAARQAIDRAKVLPRQLDAIIYTGLTRDYLEPATAHVVQAKLGAKNAVVFDLTNACHGFVNGLHVMDAFVATGQVRYGLVVTGEQGSLFAARAIESLRRTTERHQFSRLIAGLTLGDAGAATVIGPKVGPNMGFMGFMLHSEGQHAGYCTAGGPLTDGPLLTDMTEMIKRTIDVALPMFRKFLNEQLQWKVADLAKYIIHQTGRKVFRLHSQLGGVPSHIIPDTVTMFGNLVTATIPVNLHLVHSRHEIKCEDKVFLSGMGSGISLGQAGIIWDAES